LKDKGNAASVPWHDLARYQLAIRPVSAETLKKMGISADKSVEQIQQIIHEHYPPLPTSFLQFTGPEVKKQLERALHTNQSMWDCVVRHVGWWATLGLVALFGAALIIATATAGWGTPLAIWLTSVVGGGTATILVNCAINPHS
jgi:hypothetical protein